MCKDISGFVQWATAELDPKERAENNIMYELLSNASSTKLLELLWIFYYNDKEN